MVAVHIIVAIVVAAVLGVAPTLAVIVLGVAALILVAICVVLGVAMIPPLSIPVIAHMLPLLVICWVLGVL